MFSKVVLLQARLPSSNSWSKIRVDSPGQLDRVIVDLPLLHTQVVVGQLLQGGHLWGTCFASATDQRQGRTEKRQPPDLDQANNLWDWEQSALCLWPECRSPAASLHHQASPGGFCFTKTFSFLIFASYPVNQELLNCGDHWAEVSNVLLWKYKLFILCARLTKYIT